MITLKIQHHIAMVFLLMSICSFAQEKETMIFGYENENTAYNVFKNNFKVGQEVFLFGNRIKFREKPNTKCKVLGLLKTGAALKILKETTFTHLIDGEKSPWYQVSYKGQKGYILGSFIATLKLNHQGKDFYFSGKTSNQSKTTNTSYVKVRTINSKNAVVDHQIKIKGTKFSPKVYDNKGLKGIGNVLMIEYYDEVAINSFQYYMSYDGKFSTIYKCVDQGSYFESTIIFPSDEGGEKDRLYYREFSSGPINLKGTQDDEYIKTLQFPVRWKLKNKDITKEIQRIKAEIN